jgi:hypothetical protein
VAREHDESEECGLWSHDVREDVVESYGGQSTSVAAALGGAKWGCRESAEALEGGPDVGECGRLRQAYAASHRGNS